MQNLKKSLKKNKEHGMSEELIPFITMDKINAHICVKHRDKYLFVSDENLHYSGNYGDLSIRNFKNSVRIRVQVSLFSIDNRYLTDKTFDNNKKMIDADIEKIKMHRDGRTVVFNSRVGGPGKAKLKEKAPMIYQYMNARLLEVFGFDNRR